MRISNSKVFLKPLLWIENQLKNNLKMRALIIFTIFCFILMSYGNPTESAFEILENVEDHTLMRNADGKQINYLTAFRKCKYLNCSIKASDDKAACINYWTCWCVVGCADRGFNYSQCRGAGSCICSNWYRWT